MPDDKQKFEDLPEDERQRINMAAVSCGLSTPEHRKHGDPMDSVGTVTVMVVKSPGEYEFSEDPGLAKQVDCMKKTLGVK